MLETEISIVMTCFNREQFLGKAIESVLNQTEPNFELIVWDDGSTDNSLSLALSFCSDSRITVVAAPHRGASHALFNAMQLASGKYIGWVDSDDYIADNCLQATKKMLVNWPNVGMVYTNYCDVDENGHELSIGHKCIVPFMGKDTLLVAFMVFHFRLFRRELYKSVGGINTNLEAAFDYDFCLKVSEVAEIHHLPETLYFYRNHADKISNQKKDKQLICARLARKEALIRRGYEPIA